MKISTAVNIPDAHIPFNDRSSLLIILKICNEIYRTIGLTQINFLGDFLDFFWVMLHKKSKSQLPIRGTFKDEIYIGYRILKFFRDSFPDVEINFIEGNHEDRMARYLLEKAPDLFDFFDLRELLKLDELNIKLIPFGRDQLHQCLDTSYYLRHKPYKDGESTALATMKHKHISLGYGHTHRKQSVSGTDAHGVELNCRSLGWIGDIRSPVFDYMDTTNWVQSFEFIISDSENWYAQEIPIKNRKAFFNNSIFIANEYPVFYNEDPSQYLSFLDDISLQPSNKAVD